MKSYFPGLVVVGLAIMAGVASYHPAPTSDVLQGDVATQMLRNRPWVDRTSGTSHDAFNVYVFGRGGRGGFDRADSSFRHHLELDMYQATSDTVSFTFPHDNRQAQTTYKISKLSPPQNGRDLKLELTNDPMLGGSHVYFGQSRTQRDVDSDLDAFSRLGADDNQ